MLDREFYLPAPEHLAAQSTANRQGRGDVLQGDEARDVLEVLKADATRAFDHYEAMLNEDAEGGRLVEDRVGLARELARINLPLSAYTQWYWKVDLHNFMHFLALRADPHAQYEIRVYADAMISVLERWVPATFAAFRDYRLDAAELSGPAVAVVRRLLAGEAVEPAGSGLAPREWRELMQLLGRDA